MATRRTRGPSSWSDQPSPLRSVISSRSPDGPTSSILVKIRKSREPGAEITGIESRLLEIH